MAQSLKVAFDISALGAGFYHNRSRTGVFRVIESLASHLACLPECQLSLAAYESLILHARARQYLSRDNAFHNAKLLHPGGMLSELVAKLLTKTDRRQPLADYTMRGINRLGSLLPYYPALPASDQLKDYDIFHATYFGLPPSGQKTGDISRFQTIYDLIPLIMPQLTTRTHQRITRRCVDAIQPDDWVLAISEATKNDLCEYKKIDPKQVFVTPLAASRLFQPCTDPDRSRAVKEHYKIPDAPYILSLCTFEPRKNLPLLIDCFADLVRQEKLNDLNLVLVGTTGWQHEAIQSKICEHQQLRKQIIITGYVHDADLAPLYSNALMFVYPSLYEGFGLPPLEAMQCGVPVITSNSSSLPEVVGDAGIMVSPHDKQSLCQAMLDLYQQPAMVRHYAEQALARAELFSWQRCAKETLKAYSHARRS